MFSPNTDSLGYRPFKGVNWTLVLGLIFGGCHQGPIASTGPVFNPVLGLRLGPGPTRLADPNRIPRRETIYWDSLPVFFFFKSRTCTCGYGPHLIIESKYHVQNKNYHRSGVYSIYTHTLSPIYIYKTVLLHLQLHIQSAEPTVMNPY